MNRVGKRCSFWGHLVPDHSSRFFLWKGMLLKWPFQKTGKNLGGGGEFFPYEKHPMLMLLLDGHESGSWVPLGPPCKHDTRGAWTERCSWWVQKKTSPGILGVGTFRLFKAASGWKALGKKNTKFFFFPASGRVGWVICHSCHSNFCFVDSVECIGGFEPHVVCDFARYQMWIRWSMIFLVLLKIIQDPQSCSTISVGFHPLRRFLRFDPQTRNGISLQVQGVSRAKLFHESKEEVRESDIFWIGMGMGDRILLASLFLSTLKSNFDF